MFSRAQQINPNILFISNRVEEVHITYYNKSILYLVFYDYNKNGKKNRGIERSRVTWE